MNVIPSGMVTSPEEYAKRNTSAGKQEGCTGLNQYSSGGLDRGIGCSSGSVDLTQHTGRCKQTDSEPVV